MKAILYIVSIVVIGCSSKEPKNKEGHSTDSARIVEDMDYVHPDGTICHSQSPINILSFGVNAEGMHNIKFDFKDEINKVENLGHTVQLDLKEGSSITVDNETFDFKQLHFHTPSEHLIDGITYPMEMHMVHTLQGQKENETPEYLVIGVLFKMGAESKFITDFMKSIPKKAHKSQEVPIGAIHISDVISEKTDSLLNHYYKYMGSLTTPPYTESVRWYVPKTIFEASPDQIKTLLEIEGVNARHIQKVNARKTEAK